MRWFLLLLMLPSAWSLNETCDLAISPSAQAQGLEKLVFRITTENNPVNITYWIEDELGTRVKGARTTTNENTKSYTPKKVGGLLIKATQRNCSTEEAILIQEVHNEDPIDEPEPKPESTPSTVHIEDLEIEERTIIAEILVEKGTTSKRTVKATLSDDKTILSAKLNLPGTHDRIEWTLPWHVPCDEEREVFLRVEGLDEQDEEDILLPACEPLRPPSSIELYAPHVQNNTLLGFLHVYNTKPSKESYTITSYTRQGRKQTSESKVTQTQLEPDTEAWILLHQQPLIAGTHTLQTNVNVSWRKTPYRYTQEVKYQPPFVKTRVHNRTVNITTECPEQVIGPPTGNVAYQSEKTPLIPFGSALVASLGLGGWTWYRRRQR